MTAENEVDAPLILVLGPNSVLVGRGGGNIPTYYSQIVPQLESVLLGRSGAPPSSSGDANNEGSINVLGSGGVSHQEGHMMGHGSGSTRGNNGGVSANGNRWEWPSHVVGLAEDELLIVVFPTDWSRELRVALSRAVFEDLKAASAVFVCSAVAAAYAVGMGLAGNDAHAALYGDLEDQRRRQRNRKDHLFGGVHGSKNRDDDDDMESNSEEDSSEDESEVSSGSSSSDSDDEENDTARRKTNPKADTKKGKRSLSAATSSEKKNVEVASKTKRGRTNAAEEDDETAEEEGEALVRNGVSAGKDRPQDGTRRPSATTAVRPTVGEGAGGLPVKTPRKTTRLCIIELHYDRLTCSHVYNGAVSRFVSHPRLPAAAADRHGTLLSARDASNAAVIAEKERSGNGNSFVTSSTTPLSFDAVLSLCSPSAGGIIPTTLAKLERKVAADVADEEERSTAPSALFIDFQVAMVFTGEAATIKGIRESINEHFPCRSADPYDDVLGHRVILPPIAPTTVPFVQNYSGSEGQPHPTFVADLTPFLGASVLSTVPDKVIEKIAVTRALYRQKGADIILSRSAI